MKEEQDEESKKKGLSKYCRKLPKLYQRTREESEILFNLSWFPKRI